MSEQELISAIREEAKRFEEDWKFTARGHYEAANRWEKVNLWMGVSATVMAVTAASTVIGAPRLSVVLNAITAVLTGLLTFLKPCDKASVHKKAGDEFLGLRKKSGTLYRVNLLSAMPCEESRTQLLGLQDQASTLSTASPSIPRWAYKKAKEGIEAGESDYAVDKKVGA